jgi:hypothetical protein
LGYMLEHKQPGKSTLTGHHGHGHKHGHGHDHGHQPTPGKHTLVEQAGHGAIASAASVGAGGPAISTSASGKMTVHDGPVRVETTVNLSLTRGKGPVSLNVAPKGAMSVGDDHMSFDLSTPAAAKLGKLGLTGASATVTKDGTHQTQVSVNGGALTGSWTTTYTIKTHEWTASLSVAAVASAKPKPPERHGISKIVHSITHVLATAGHIAASALKDIVHADVNIVNSTKDWGPALLESLAAAAAAGDTIVIAV